MIGDWIHDVIFEALIIVTRGWLTGSAETAPRDAVDRTELAQLWREFIKHVRSVARSG